MDPQRALLTGAFDHRNQAARRVFDAEAGRLAMACREMAGRFARGGRLLAFGTPGGITDAQHVAVEFVHPVLVGKRALPAIDISARYCRWLTTLAGPDDIVMGFDPTGGDPDAARSIAAAAARGAQTFALSGPAGHYAIQVTDPDPFIHQEIVETLYHVLWETVHVFLEHAALGHDAGAASFLYPFLGASAQDTGALVSQVADSIRSKVRENERLRDAVAVREGEAIVAAAFAIHDRLARGGRLLIAGNGGSATDATDWALDCIDSPKGHAPIAALSLAADAPTISAIANDVGQDVIFVRQVIAHAGPHDVLVVISTSGGSANIIAALAEARRRHLLTIGLTGYDGGDIARRRLADFVVTVPSDYIPRIQEVQASVYHVMVDVLAAMAQGAAAAS